MNPQVESIESAKDVLKLLDMLVAGIPKDDERFDVSEILSFIKGKEEREFAHLKEKEEREFAHAERMKALEVGQPVPDDDKNLINTLRGAIITINLAMIIGAVMSTWYLQKAPDGLGVLGIWVSTAMVVVGTVITGFAFLASRHKERSKRFRDGPVRREGLE